MAGEVLLLSVGSVASVEDLALYRAEPTAVELPKPITKKIAEAWNSLFK